MPACTSSLTRVLAAGLIAAVIAQGAAASDMAARHRWALTTTVFGPEDASIGLGRLVGDDLWIFSGLSGDAASIYQEQAITDNDRQYDLEFRWVGLSGGIGVEKDLIEWEQLRLRAGASIAIIWIRGKAEFIPVEGGNRIGGEYTDWNWRIGPCLEVERPIRGPLALAIFVQPVHYGSQRYRQDGIIATWFAESHPEKGHDQTLRAEFDPALLVRLRF